MPAPGFGKIVVATDGSTYGQHAVDIAIDLAKRYGSLLSIVSVAPLVPIGVNTSEPWVPKVGPDRETEHYRAVLKASVERAEAAGLSTATGVLLEGVVVDEILAHVERSGVDLLVLGSRGLSTAKRLLLGSVSDALLHHLKVPVLVVREPPA